MYSFGEFLAHPRRFDAQPWYYYSSQPRQTAIADRVLFGTAWVNSRDGADQLTAAPRNVDGSRTPRLQWIIGALLDGRSRAREPELSHPASTELLGTAARFAHGKPCCLDTKTGLAAMGIGPMGGDL